jgi:hypothetical protein
MGNSPKNIQPRSLTDSELVRYYAMLLDEDDKVPVNWQAELLRRFLSRLDSE